MLFNCTRLKKIKFILRINYLYIPRLAHMCRTGKDTEKEDLFLVYRVQEKRKIHVIRRLKA